MDIDVYGMEGVPEDVLGPDAGAKQDGCVGASSEFGLPASPLRQLLAWPPHLNQWKQMKMKKQQMALLHPVTLQDSPQCLPRYKPSLAFALCLHRTLLCLCARMFCRCYVISGAGQ
jgi:hypothetical protein